MNFSNLKVVACQLDKCTKITPIYADTNRLSWSVDDRCSKLKSHRVCLDAAQASPTYIGMPIYWQTIWLPLSRQQFGVEMNWRGARALGSEIVGAHPNVCPALGSTPIIWLGCSRLQSKRTHNYQLHCQTFTCA